MANDDDDDDDASASSATWTTRERRARARAIALEATRWSEVRVMGDGMDARARANASEVEGADAGGGGGVPPSPGGFRGGLDGRDGEDHASTARALDALRARDAGREGTDGGRAVRGMGGGWLGEGGVVEGEGGGLASAETYEGAETYETGGGAASAVAFAKVGERSVAIGDAGGNLVVVRYATNDVDSVRACEMGAHRGPIVSCDWSTSGARLLTVSKDGTLKAWNVTHTSKTTIQITKQCEINLFVELTCVRFHSSQDDVVFVGTRSREMLVVDAGVGSVLERFETKAVPLCVDSNTSGNTVFVGDDEGQVSVLTCEPRMKKMLSMNSEGDAAVENPIQRVIQERSASQSERMGVVGFSSNSTIQASEVASKTSRIRAGLSAIMLKAKKAVPKLVQLKTGYRLRQVTVVSGSFKPSPIRAIRYCPFIEVMSGAALMIFHECGAVEMYHARDLPYTDFRSFALAQVSDWRTQNDCGGVVSFTHGLTFEVPLMSASILKRTAIYSLPASSGLPARAMQYTDTFDEGSADADVATVSAWSHDSADLYIGYASGKIVHWRRKRTS